MRRRARVPAAWRRTLERYVGYYTALRPDERARFERDVAVFIDDAEITGINATVSDEVRRPDGVPRGLDLATRRRWQRLVESELGRARRGDAVLVDYARTNEVELLAVAVEWLSAGGR